MLKDYLVYIPEEAKIKNDKVVFANYDGGEKTYTLDWSQYGITEGNIYCMFNYYQDANSNSVLLALRVRKETTADYYLFMMDSNGQLTEIYKRTR